MQVLKTHIVSTDARVFCNCEIASATFWILEFPNKKHLHEHSLWSKKTICKHVKRIRIINALYRMENNFVYYGTWRDLKCACLKLSLILWWLRASAIWDLPRSWSPSVLFFCSRWLRCMFSQREEQHALSIIEWKHSEWQKIDVTVLALSELSCHCYTKLRKFSLLSASSKVVKLAEMGKLDI